MNPSVGVLALFIVAFGGACASTPPAVSSTASAAATAGVDPDAQRKAEHIAAHEGCVLGIRSPNEREYAKHVQTSGIGAEGAAAEARFVFDLVNDGLGSICDCMFEAFGGWDTMAAAAAQSGQPIDAWMQQQMANPAVRARAAQCATKVEGAMAGLKDHESEITAFRQRWRDEHPADAGRFECRSKQSEAKGNLKALYVMEESYRAEFDAYDVDLKTIGFDPRSGAGSKPRYRYEVTSASPSAFVAHAIGIDEMAGDVWTITQDNDLTNGKSVCPADE